MAKYLFHGNFVGDGVKGLVKEGGSGRVAAVPEGHPKSPTCGHFKIPH